MPNSVLRIGFLFLVVMVLTQSLQTYVGDSSLYQEKNLEKRADLHEAILSNDPGERSWQERGANGTNVRILVVYLADSVAEQFDLDINRVYRGIDTLSLALLFVTLLLFFRQFFSIELSAIGLLYFSFSLISTYHLHYFHPWDRFSAFLWTSLLYAAAFRRAWIFGLLLFIAMLVKGDVLFLPLLPALNDWFSGRIKSSQGRCLCPWILCFCITVSLHLGLRIFLPAETVSLNLGSIVQQLQRNAGHFRAALFSYPPLLMFLVPIAVISWGGWKCQSLFGKSCILFAAIQIVPYILIANFGESRSLVPILLVLMVPSLTSWGSMLSDTKRPTALPSA